MRCVHVNGSVMGVTSAVSTREEADHGTVNTVQQPVSDIIASSVLDSWIRQRAEVTELIGHWCKRCTEYLGASIVACCHVRTRCWLNQQLGSRATVIVLFLIQEYMSLEITATLRLDDKQPCRRLF